MVVDIDIIKEGDGKTFPKKGDYLTIHYKARVEHQSHDFDDSRTVKSPYTFKVGYRKVIDGWDKAFLSGQISLGTKAKLRITYEDAYYEKGASPYVPAKATVFYEIELLRISNSGCIIL
ncbi:hypothetical protein ABK040_010469 [Willaertia magna]